MWIDVLTWMLLATGAVFSIIGAAGILRFPDFYTRTHAAGITDTMGAGPILLGLMLQAGKLAYAADWSVDSVLVIGKLAMVGAFILLTSPTAGHALFKAAFAAGVKIETDDQGVQRFDGEGGDDVPG